MIDKLEKQLEAIGLQEKEAKVYLASLELGQATVQHIAEKAQIKRPTTYFIIEGLMTHGLMSSYYQGKRQYFVAAHPDQLLEIMAEQKRDLEKREESFRAVLPQLQSLNNREQGKPVVKYYEGKAGLTSMFDEHIKTSRGQEMLGVYSRDVVAEFINPQETESVIKNRLSHKIKARTIYTWSKGNLPDLPDTERVRVAEKDFPVTCDIAIFEDKIRIASLKNRLIGVVIEDKEIAKSFRSIFEFAWKWAQHQRSKQ